MIKNFECEGEWWLPSNPDKKLSGKLTFSIASSPKLELNGAFEEYSLPTVLDFSTNVAPFKNEIILGISRKGELVTAANCQGYPSLVNDFEMSSFTVNRIFVGIHFEKEEEIKFNSLSIKFSFLDQWVNASWAKIIKQNGKSLSVQFEEPTPIEIVLDNGLTVIIRSWISESWSPGDLHFKRNSQVELKFLEGINLDDWFEHINILSQFLCLAISNPVYPLNLTGHTNKQGQEFSTEILYRMASYPQDPNEILHPAHMNFSFTDIKGRLSDLLKKWFSEHEVLETVYGLYFGVFFNNQRVHTKDEFLNLVTALETYHRKVVVGKGIDETKHGEMLSLLEDKFKDLKYWWKARLRYNEPTFEMRLKDIQKILENNFVWLIGQNGLPIEKIKDTRNYYVHFDNHLKGKEFTPKQRFAICEKIKVILQALFMMRMGFSSEETSKFLQARNWNKTALFQEV